VLFATRFIHQFPHEVKHALLKEFRRVLRPGGLIVVEFYARPYHTLRYFLGGRKGRSRDAYFRHYPTSREVQEVVGTSFEVHPLRLVGSRVMARVLGEEMLRRVTRTGARLLGGILVDEYFVVAGTR
jgi:hypothetical protein